MVHRTSSVSVIYALILACAMQVQADTKTHLKNAGKRIRHAAWNATKDPQTWIPAGFALGIAAARQDQAISDWATRRNPIFGTTQKADEMSDILREASLYANGVTGVSRYGLALYRRSPYTAASGVAMSLTAASLTSGITGYFKHSVGRERPDDSDTKSFPSGHTSTASLAATLAAKNVEALPLPNYGKIGLKTGFAALTYGTGWARVEADKHYLSDILAGAALGHFLGVFLHDAILGDNHENIGVDVGVTPSQKAVYMGVGLKF